MNYYEVFVFEEQMEFIGIDQSSAFHLFKVFTHPFLVTLNISYLFYKFINLVNSTKIKPYILAF